MSYKALKLFRNYLVECKLRDKITIYCNAVPTIPSPDRRPLGNPRIQLCCLHVGTWPRDCSAGAVSDQRQYLSADEALRLYSPDIAVYNLGLFTVALWDCFNAHVSMNTPTQVLLEHHLYTTSSHGPLIPSSSACSLDLFLYSAYKSDTHCDKHGKSPLAYMFHIVLMIIDHIIRQ